VQALGTHNSYHIQPDVPLDDSWRYTMAPLDLQLSQQGVRQVELDLHWNQDLGHFEVYHVPIVDPQSTCLAFTDCLQTMRDWSDANPGHLPLMVLIEPKNEGATVLWEERVDEYEAEVDSVWPASRRLSPDELQGAHGSLREAVLAEGWPTLGALRGKIIFGLLDTGSSRDAYTAKGTSLAGRTTFAAMEDQPDSPLASFFLQDDPVGDSKQIAAYVDQGFLVRTRADADGPALVAKTEQLQAALDSGANWLSTDYPAKVAGVPYVAAVPEGTPARCNPRTAPPECTSQDIEDPAFVH